MIDVFRLFCLIVGIWLAIQYLQFRHYPDHFVVEALIFGIYGGICLTLLAWSAAAPVFLSSLFWLVPMGFCLAFSAALLLLAVFTALYPYLAPKRAADGTESILLVLGAPVWKSMPTSLLTSRGLAAAQWKKQHPDANVILSGGVKDACSEAHLLERIMMEQLGAVEHVFLEQQSLTTDENFLYSRPICTELGWKPENPLVVTTNNFHFFRLRYYAKRNGYEKIHFLIVPTPPQTAFIWYFREAIVLIRYWLLKK